MNIDVAFTHSFILSPQDSYQDTDKLHHILPSFLLFSPPSLSIYLSSSLSRIFQISLLSLSPLLLEFLYTLLAMDAYPDKCNFDIWLPPFLFQRISLFCFSITMYRNLDLYLLLFTFLCSLLLHYHGSWSQPSPSILHQQIKSSRTQ